MFYAISRVSAAGVGLDDLLPHALGQSGQHRSSTCGSPGSSCIWRRWCWNSSHLPSPERSSQRAKKNTIFDETYLDNSPRGIPPTSTEARFLSSPNSAQRMQIFKATLLPHAAVEVPCSSPLHSLPQIKNNAKRSPTVCRYREVLEPKTKCTAVHEDSNQKSTRHMCTREPGSSAHDLGHEAMNDASLAKTLVVS